jgi:L-2-hydroxycarboxylate dehydrogenase (NAD+)
MGRVQQLAREGKELPPGAAVDENGQPTTDPNQAKYLVPFGAHKGYGMALMNEIIGGFIGGSLPTIRNRWDQVPKGEKGTCCFFFQVWHPDAMNAGAFAKGRNQSENVKAVIGDILGHGNENCMLPGQLEAQAAARSAKNGGLLFSEAEIQAFNELAKEAGKANWNLTEFKQAE